MQVLGLPITVIGGSFDEVYKEDEALQAKAKRRAAKVPCSCNIPSYG